MTTTASITCAGCKGSYQDTALYCPHCGRPKARDAVQDALIGKVLGERFQVQAVLGQGASGTIYRAEHVTLRRKVAIKVLHNELSRDDLAVERFRREATTVAEIDNEHIVEIHDFGRTDDGRLYLAMELLEGETLDGILARETTLSVERATDILIQVGEALMEAHAIGYVHRDLRPRNIYLAVRRGKANFVKLLDFGLAKLVETDAQAASTSLGMTFGDPRYMSPEQARGDRIDLRADIYQLGCVAYEMLTGAPPFAGHRVFDILTKQVSEAPAPLPTRRPGVPLWLEQSVAKMLAKDPANRFATMTRMVESLRRGLETGEVMEDEVARRRESVPPPSVSRVMAKLGMQVDAAGNALPAAVAALATKPFDPKQTQLGSAAGPTAPPKEPVSAEASAPVPVTTAPLPVMEPRRRTGTPRVGVPVAPVEPAAPRAPASAAPVSAPVTAPIVAPVAVPVTAPIAVPVSAPVFGPSADDSQAPVAGSIDAAPRARRESAAPPESTGRVRRPTKDPLTESQVWFADGDADEPDRSRTDRARKVISPSLTDLDDEAAPRKRRVGLMIAIGAVLVAGAGVVWAVSSGGGDRGAAPPPTPVAVAAPVDAAPSTVIEPPDAVAAAPDAAAQVAVAAAPRHPAGTAPTPVDPTPTPPVSGHVPTVDDDPAARRPTGLGVAVTPPPTPTPTPGKGSATRGVGGADGPVDPYAPADAPADAAGDKKAEFYANLGAQQLASGDVAASAASYKRAIELDPKSVAAVTGLGEIALRQGLFGDAIAHLGKAARLAPKSSKVYTLLGEAYMNSGQSAQAVANFKKALQLDPDNARAREGFNEASARVPPPTDDGN